MDKLLIPWNLQTGKPGDGPELPNSVTAIFAKEGLMLLGDESGEVVVTGSEGRVPTFKAHGGRVTNIELVDQGPKVRGIISSSLDQSVKRYGVDPDTGKFEVSRVFRSHNKPVVCMTQGPGFVATGATDGSVKLWDVTLDSERFTWSDHVGAVRALAFAKNQALLVSGGADGAIRFHRATPRPAYGPVNLPAAPAGNANDEE